MIYLDFGIETEPFSAAIARGLRRMPKRISPKYLYNPRGSELFEEICKQPEYYPTRTELRILYENIGEIATSFLEGSMLIEFGSGSSLKTRVLLDLAKFQTYIPLDISKDFLLKTAEDLQRRYPQISILPACGDFTREIQMPSFFFQGHMTRVAFLPGSTLGNFDPVEAVNVLQSIRGILGSGHLLLGIDLAKDPIVLEAAYNDAAGVTAAFNLNLIQRLCDETGANISPEDFRHLAFFNSDLGRIEMHLRATRDIRFDIRGETFEIAEGEMIHTENSYKYSPHQFEGLCTESGFEVERFWTDSNEWFGVFLLRVRDSRAAEAWAA